MLTLLTSTAFLLLQSSPTHGSDGKTCVTMEPICTDQGLQFTALGGDDTAPIGNNYDCLASQYEPTWYYLKISSNTPVGSDLFMTLSAPQDIDFIIYGPFNNLNEAISTCGSLGTGSDNFNDVKDCGYSSTNQETPHISNVKPNEVYVMLISNFKRIQQTISLSLDSSSTGSTDCSIVTNPDPENPCIYGTNYFFNGNQAHATGDPHFKMWNGDNHDFQGVGSINDQYYYITRDSESTSTDLPFNVLGKHYYYQEGNTQMRSVDYITIELFDKNDDYYLIFLQSNILQYTRNPVSAGSTSTLYNNINPSLLSTFIPGESQQIGQLFTALVTSKNNYEIHFTLLIAADYGDCEFKFHMHNIGDSKPALNNRYVQDLYIDPPNCYQCFITGLLGDFKQAKIEGPQAKMQICNGAIYYMDITSGWEDKHNTAYDERGLSYKKSDCHRGLSRRRRLQTEVIQYIPSAPDNFVYVDLCPIDSEIAQLTITECENIRQQYDLTLCAPQSMIHLCDTLQDNCEYDACILADGNILQVVSAAQNVFANSLGFLNRIPNIADLNNEINTQYKLKCPTGSYQIGPINADISGCGLERCVDRYGSNNVQQCMDHCLANAQCKSFTFAPIGGDKAILNENVCTIYNSNTHTWLWGPNQIMCGIDQPQ